MRRLLASLAIILGTITTSGAADCPYVSADGRKAIERDPSTIEVTEADGRKVECPTLGAGTGMDLRVVSCSDADYTPYFFAPSKAGTKDFDLLILMNQVWYRRCS